NKYDEKLMEYYLSSNIVLVDISGNISSTGLQGIFKSISLSPNGDYILAQRVVPPYSYLVPIQLFPSAVSVYTANGEKINDIYTVPLADNLPISFDAVLEGPRNFRWRKDKDATLVFLKAADKGNPSIGATVRDEVFELNDSFNLASAKRIYSGSYRIRDIQWGSEVTIVEESWRKDRTSKLTVLEAKNNEVIKALPLRKSEDTYTDPGTFIKGPNDLLLTDGKGILFTKGIGASPEGDRPFLMKWNV